MSEKVKTVTSPTIKKNAEITPEEALIIVNKRKALLKKNAAERKFIWDSYKAGRLVFVHPEITIEKDVS